MLISYNIKPILTAEQITAIAEQFRPLAERFDAMAQQIAAVTEVVAKQVRGARND